MVVAQHIVAHHRHVVPLAMQHDAVYFDEFINPIWLQSVQSEYFSFCNRVRNILGIGTTERFENNTPPSSLARHMPDGIEIFCCNRVRRPRLVDVSTALSPRPICERRKINQSIDCLIAKKASEIVYRWFIALNGAESNSKLRNDLGKTMRVNQRFNCFNLHARWFQSIGGDNAIFHFHFNQMVNN